MILQDKMWLTKLKGRERQAHQDVEKALRREVGEETWDYHVDLGIVKDYTDVHHDMNVLVKEFRKFYVAAGEETSKRRSPRRLPSTEAESEWREAVSLYLAMKASKDEEVNAFRRDVLGGVLVGENQLAQWIGNRARAEKTGHWLTVPVPEGYELDWSLGPSVAWGTTPPLTISVNGIPAESVSGRQLHYFDPAAKEEAWVYTAPGGVLERLRQLGSQLADKYGWTQAQAVTFLVTGSAPFVVGIIAETTHSVEQPLSTRITLTIDPTVTADEVKAFYAQQRKQLLSRSTRKINHRNATLVEFVLIEKGNDTWAKSMKKWNAKYGTKGARWTYTNYRNFSRDYNESLKHLTDISYAVPEWALDYYYNNKYDI